MERILTQFANSGASEKADLLSSLGIDWTLLALQTVAFLILLFVLRKFVYPPMMEMIVNSTLELVAEAAGKVLNEKINSKKDAKLISTALEEAE